VTQGEAPAALPGWYPDPEGSGSQRYWDGTRWSPPPPAGPPADQQTVASGGESLGPAPSSRPPRSDALERLAQQPSTFWFSILAAVLMVIGGFGTWATALGIVSIPGTRGEDGWFVIGAAVVGLMAVWSRCCTNRVDRSYLPCSAEGLVQSLAAK